MCVYVWGGGHMTLSRLHLGSFTLVIQRKMSAGMSYYTDVIFKTVNCNLHQT